jgi:hypothetical protein
MGYFAFEFVLPLKYLIRNPILLFNKLYFRKKIIYIFTYIPKYVSARPLAV